LYISKTKNTVPFAMGFGLWYRALS
jgi:hypothetical protein